jgi:phenylalanyl-tRNA synthetase beta chain
MKVSLNWLRELVELPASVPELVDLLTLAGVEVEEIETLGVSIPKLVVAEIRESVQHPNADRLSVCQVDDGSGAPRQIVCGAKNYKVGDKVPLALPGAVLPGDFKINVGKLRGVESQGMMCSADELGLPKGEDGLLILPADAQPGASLSALFPSDTVLDLEITPNRADLLCHIGIAREIAALTGKQFKPPVETMKLGGFGGSVIDVASSQCRLYTAQAISNVQVGPSPEWLRRKLEAIGLRAINNIVDITNYVMFQTGQPLHAFDADKLVGDIRVRMATEGEEFVALDGRTYRLGPQHLVIADGSRPIALGGVMGGAATGVTESTRAILLESAYFEPANIRRTSRSLGIASDSSYRFERGVDIDGVVHSCNLAAALVEKLAGGALGELGFGFAQDSTSGVDPGPMLDEQEGPVYTHTVPLRAGRCAALLGAPVTEERIDGILNGFGLRKAKGGWEIPSFRRDLTREVDLIEEVARVVGIDSIPGRAQARFAPVSAADRQYDAQMTLRRALAGCGFAEARTLMLVGDKAPGISSTGVALEDFRRIKNPMNDDQVILRPCLLSGLLKALTSNLRAGAKTVRLFEIGRVFSAKAPEETAHLGFVLSGSVAERTWRSGEGADADLFDLKGVVASVLEGPIEFTPTTNPSHALALEIKVAGRGVGIAGQLWPKDARALDAEAPVLFAEIDLELLPPVSDGKKYGELPRFPAVTRDIALIAPLSLPHAEIVAVLRSAGEALLVDVELFDVFTDATGVRVPADRKSIAYSLTYRSPERTLTTDEVNAAHARLKERLKTQLGVSPRE